MSKRVIYKCDRCGKTAETKEEEDKLELFNLAVGIVETPFGSFSYDHHYLADDLHREQQWCLRCCEDTGFIKLTEKPESETPKPTLIELLKEFIRY